MIARTAHVSVICDGRKLIKSEPKITTTVHGATVQLRYALMMLALPGLLVATNRQGAETPLLFKFKEGVGALMPTRGQFAEHVEIETDKAA